MDIDKLIRELNVEIDKLISVVACLEQLRGTSGASATPSRRGTKRFADVASLPPDFEIAPEWDVCLASIARPAAQERIRMLMERGFHQPGDVENRLGYYVGQLGR